MIREICLGCWHGQRVREVFVTQRKPKALRRNIPLRFSLFCNRFDWFRPMDKGGACIGVSFD